MADRQLVMARPEFKLTSTGPETSQLEVRLQGMTAVVLTLEIAGHVDMPRRERLAKIAGELLAEALDGTTLSNEEAGRVAPGSVMTVEEALAGADLSREEKTVMVILFGASKDEASAWRSLSAEDTKTYKETLMALARRHLIDLRGDKARFTKRGVVVLAQLASGIPA